MSPSPPPAAILSAVDFDRLRPRLHRYCTRMVGSALDGEDIVQDAMVRALESAAPDRPIENAEAWLFRIAHNLALDLLRRRMRAGDNQADDDVEALVDPVDEQARREAAAASLPAFMRMPASQRSVVILFDVLDYSAQEVGEILGTSVPAVKSLLQRGRGRLRELAGETAQAPRALAPAEEQLLRRYVDLFNAHDFDTLRSMLAADVRLDLVNRLQRQGGAVGEYFGRYGQVPGWRAWPGVVEGRPAVLMQNPARADARPDYFVVLSWSGDRVATIRDFLFARYAMDDAAWAAL
jgi:RNA polymerase sigma-70 factor (ECF subfamily)